MRLLGRYITTTLWYDIKQKLIIVVLYEWNDDKLN